MLGCLGLAVLGYSELVVPLPRWRQAPSITAVSTVLQCCIARDSYTVISRYSIDIAAGSGCVYTVRRLVPRSAGARGQRAESAAPRPVQVSAASIMSSLEFLNTQY